MNDDEKDRQFREAERKSDWARGILAQERDRARENDDGDWEHNEEVQP